METETRKKIQILKEKFDELLRKDGQKVYVLHPETDTWVTEEELLKENKLKNI